MWEIASIWIAQVIKCNSWVSNPRGLFNLLTTEIVLISIIFDRAEIERVVETKLKWNK